MKIKHVKKRRIKEQLIYVTNMDMVIRNGIVVNGNKVVNLDIAVKDGKIAVIGKITAIDKNLNIKIKNTIDAKGKSLSVKAKKIIDAKGKYVLPGFIDAHAHMHLPVGKSYSADDFTSGTKAAAAGGVTTIVDFVTPVAGSRVKGQGSREGNQLVSAIQKRIKEAQDNSLIDFLFHFTTVKPDKETFSVLKKLHSYNFNSLKIYMVYKEAGLMMEYSDIPKVMFEAKKQNLLFGVHAENYYELQKLKNKFIKENKTTAYYHYFSRPNKVEADAVKICVDFAKKTGCKLYFVHISAKESLNIIRKAQKVGVKIYAETCPQYLTFTKEKYKEKDGIFYLASPSFKSKSDINALWKALADNTISVVASDHCPFTKKQKLSGGGRFYLTPNGLPGIETLAALLYTHGVLKKKITLAKMIQLISENPAKIFNLYPKKGMLKTGADADIVIFDPKAKKKITPKNLNSNTDFNPYDGMTLYGWPEYTICRGKIIYHNGKFLVKPGYGKIVKCRN